jgi:hypothetical protein
MFGPREYQDSNESLAIRSADPQRELHGDPRWPNLHSLASPPFCQRRLQLRYLHKQLSKSRVPTPFTIPTGIWELDLLHLSDEK